MHDGTDWTVVQNDCNVADGFEPHPPNAPGSAGDFLGGTCSRQNAPTDPRLPESREVQYKRGGKSKK